MNSTARIGAVVAATLMRGPCGMADICAALGIDTRHSEVPSRYIKELHDLGVVYIFGWTRNHWPIYAWQPKEPFGMVDVPKPLSKPQQAKRDAALRRLAGTTYERPLQPKIKRLPDVPNSVFALSGI